MPTFNNGERGDSIRTKLNNVINRTERVMLLDDVTQLASLVYTADSQWTVSAGMQVHTVKEGFAYEVLASGASTFDIQPGAVKLDLLPMANGSYNFRGMLPVANGTTDDYPLLAKLLAKPAGGVLSIYFPTGNYRMNTTIELKRVVRFWGDAGFAGADAGRLTFAADLTGIVINRFNTLNGTTETVPTTAADGSVVDGLAIYSAGGTDRTKAGIWMRARGTIRNTFVYGFPGNGIQVIAGAGAGGSAEGNANCFYIESCTCVQNKNHGFYCDGADANAGTITLMDCNSNGRFGFYDSSFLGNTYVGCHAASNGLQSVGGNSSTQSCVVNYAGKSWGAHWTATEAELVATEPGTDATVWIDRGATAVYPTWVSGQPVGTYFVAYAYYNEALTAESVFIGCYNEMDCDVVFQGPCVVVGGLMSNVRFGDRIRAATNGVLSATQFSTSQAGMQAWLTDGTAYETWTGTANPGAETWRWKRTASGGIQLDNANSGFRVPFQISGNSDTVPWRMNFLSGFLLGGKQFNPGTAAPTTGTYAVGDRVFNTNPAVGQPKGWICTVAGTPGTWVSEGNL